MNALFNGVLSKSWSFDTISFVYFLAQLLSVGRPRSLVCIFPSGLFLQLGLLLLVVLLLGLGGRL